MAVRLTHELFGKTDVGVNDDDDGVPVKRGAALMAELDDIFSRSVVNIVEKSQKWTTFMQHKLK